MTLSLLTPAKPYGIIRKIFALPSSPRSGSPLQLQLQVTSLVPYMKPKNLVVAASDVILAKPVCGPITESSTGPHRASKSTSPHGRSKLSPYHPLWEWFTKEKFIDVNVKNRIWPMSIAIDAAWADNDGRTLDKVVQHRR